MSFPTRRQVVPLPGPARSQDGSALIWALFFVSVTTGLMLSHSWELRSNRKQMDVRFRQLEHARAFARSGLAEATSWFQRQTVQPVTVFAPRKDATAEPPVDETQDPDVGLVREFEVRGSLWGRYEVRKDECVDVSADHASAPGTVWDIAARGILFERRDARKPFDKYPNHVIAIQSTRTELRGLAANLPAATAIVLPDPGRLTILGTDLTVDGAGAAGIACQASNAPVAPVPGLIGAPAVLPLTSLASSPEDIFGLRAEHLEALADIALTDDTWSLTRPLAGRMAFAPKDLTVVAKAPLNGSGVLLVQGDLRIEEGTSSSFQGLLLVGGNATLCGPLQLRGSLVVGGSLTLDSGPGAVDIVYDEDALSTATASLTRYHKSKDTRGGAGTQASTPVAEFADKMLTGDTDAAAITELAAADRAAKTAAASEPVVSVTARSTPDATTTTATSATKPETTSSVLETVVDTASTAVTTVKKIP